MLFSIHIVKGHSMSPRFNEGDFVVASHWLKHRLQTHDVIVIKHPAYGVIIKRVTCINANGTITLTGDHPGSTSPEQLGTITLDNVIGRVLWHIKAPKI